MVGQSAGGARLHRLAEAAPDAILVLGPDPFVRYVNPAAEKTFGYPPREFVGNALPRYLRADLDDLKAVNDGFGRRVACRDRTSSAKVRPARRHGRAPGRRRARCLARARGRRSGRATIDLARALGVGPVVEGVKTTRQSAALRRMGCELAQGYYFWRPLPGEAATRLLDKKKGRVHRTGRHAGTKIGQEGAKR